MKRILLIALCLIMVSAAALAEAKKTEVVYGKLDLKGGLSAVYIVNGFETAEAAEVTDYGDYTEVINLSGTEALSPRDGALTLQLSRGRFYYQGNPEPRPLPWDIAFSYKLDGSDIEPEALSGASGHFEMTLSVTAREDLIDYAKALTLQISLTLDGERCLNISAPDGTVAAAGGNLTLAYVVLPGQSVSYTFSADVKDFMMAAPQIAGLRMVMDVAQYRAVAEEAMAGTPMAQAAGPLLQNFMTAMQDTVSLSFADRRNGEVDSLQFVLMGSEIPKKPAPVTEAPAAGQQRDSSFGRFLALFGL